jgi:23S rRNA pseudouridine1911/1915/1917 synthase
VVAAADTPKTSTHVLEVSAANVGQRVDSVVSKLIPQFSRARVQALIAAQRVFFEGKPVKASWRLKATGSLTVAVPEMVSATPAAEAIELDIVYEDSELLVVNKPAGLVVHPGAGHSSGTLVNALLHHIKDFAGIGGVLRPGIVHRLDKDTSGLVVVAKSDSSLNALQKQFRERSVEKTYLSLVHGDPPDSGTFDTFYGRHKTQRLKFTSRLASGKRAVTHFETLKRAAGFALVRVVLETGRTHQIRVHLAEAGFPLVGEALYQRSRRADDALISRQALHAWRLSFQHPGRRKKLSFSAAVPSDFARAVAACGMTLSKALL